MEIAFWFLVGLPIVVLLWVIIIYDIVSLYKLIKETLEQG